MSHLNSFFCMCLCGRRELVKLKLKQIPENFPYVHYVALSSGGSSSSIKDAPVETGVRDFNTESSSISDLQSLDSSKNFAIFPSSSWTADLNPSSSKSPKICKYCHGTISVSEATTILPSINIVKSIESLKVREDELNKFMSAIKSHNSAKNGEVDIKSNGEDDCFPSSVDSLANSFKTMDLSSHESEKNTKMAGNTHQNSILAARRDRKRIPQQKEFDFWDTPAYASDIYDYLREAEIKHKPCKNYMAKQTDIKVSMRWALVDWLVGVNEAFSLHSETSFLAVSYIDRFLSRTLVKRDKLQLVGITALFIASKCENRRPPPVLHFADITNHSYSVKEILHMEYHLLKVLKCDMIVPVALSFLNYFSKICECDEETHYLAMLLAELSLIDWDSFLHFLPSMIGAASVALANHTQGREAWPKIVAQQARYSLNDLRECYTRLHHSFCRLHMPPNQLSIRVKYKAKKWHCVSTIKPADTFPW